MRGALHPDRAVPEPAETLAATTLPPGLPARPFAVLLAAGALAALGMLAGLPGLALLTAALIAPAALLLRGPREWIRPALAPLLGVIGAAPAFLAIAARRDGAGARAASAALAWAWTGIAGAILGRSLGVGDPTADAAGWASSGPVATDSVLAALATPEAIAVGLIWVGAAVLLGIVLDATSPAGAVLGGLLWTAGVVSALAAVRRGGRPDAAAHARPRPRRRLGDLGRARPARRLALAAAPAGPPIRGPSARAGAESAPQPGRRPAPGRADPGRAGREPPRARGASRGGYQGLNRVTFPCCPGHGGRSRRRSRTHLP